MSITSKSEPRKKVLAEDNLHCQELLFHELAAARVESGASIEEVADCLGIPVDVALAVEDGRVELTLADLRQYAYAVGALVSYRVRPAYVRELGDLPTPGHSSDWNDALKDSSWKSWSPSRATSVIPAT